MRRLFTGTGWLAPILFGLLATSSPLLAGDEGAGRAKGSPAVPGELTARDLKAIHYLENAHGQLDEFGQWLLARLERNLGPRESDPVLDGRADLQVLKIRITYAGYAANARLAATFRALADAHEARLDALRRMIGEGADEATYRALDEPVQRLAERIRNWRSEP